MFEFFVSSDRQSSKQRMMAKLRSSTSLTFLSSMPNPDIVASLPMPSMVSGRSI